MSRADVRQCQPSRTRNSFRSASARTTSRRRSANHQVVIVAGETGSGKTTQLPKICLELGRGVEGPIGHTQPRRIAARAVAERIAEELTPSSGRRRLQGALHRPIERRHPGQGDDRRHPARRDRSAIASCGATTRSSSTRRTSAASTSTSSSATSSSCCRDGRTSRSSSRRRPSTRSDSRSTSTTPRSSRCPGARIPSRCATGRSPTTMRTTIREPAIDQASATPSRSSCRDRPGRHTRVPLRRAGDPRRRRCAAQTAAPLTPRSCRCTRGCRPPSSIGSSQPHRAPRRARHERRRDLPDRSRHPVRRRPGTGPHLAVQRADQGAAPADRADLARPAPTSARDAAAGSRTASASGCTPRRTSRRGRSSPIPRSCVRTSPPSSCR